MVAIAPSHSGAFCVFTQENSQSTDRRRCDLSFLCLFEIAVASPPDRRVTRDDIGVASAGVLATANNAAATGCTSTSGTASTRARNSSTSPGRNGQLSSKSFPKYYLPEIRFSANRPYLRRFAPTCVYRPSDVRGFRKTVKFLCPCDLSRICLR